jgi:hypothetical protein
VIFEAMCSLVAINVCSTGTYYQHLQVKGDMLIITGMAVLQNLFHPQDADSRFHQHNGEISTRPYTVTSWQRVFIIATIA